MPTFFNAILQAARGGICDLVDLSERISPPQPLRSLDLLEPYRRQFRNFLATKFCNKPPLPPPQGFDGGQCPGDNYQVLFTRVIRFWDSGRPDLIEQAETRAVGPVRSLAPGIINSQSGTDTYDLIISDGLGVQGANVPVVVARTPGNGAIKEVQFVGFVLNNLTNPGAQCGQPDLTPPYDKNDFTFNTTINYEDNDNNSFSIPVTFVVGIAYLDANLNVNVPVNISLNPSLNPSLNQKFDLGIDFNISTGEERWRNPSDPEAPTPRPPIPPNTRPDGYEAPDAPPPPPDAPDPPPTPPDKRTRRVIKAALVTVIEVAESTRVGQLFQEENPDIALPNYGYLNFLCRAGTLSGGWTPDQPIKNARCFVPCPWEGGAYDVKGTPQPGIQFVITPVYAEVAVSV